MGEELNNIYNAIIVSLIIGIIITIIVLKITFEPEEHFTEIYFENHENLPEKVKLNNEYAFSFTLHSLENSSKNYGYESKIELYNLYDITEGTYRCLGKFRDKIRLKWELGELMDNNTYLTIKNILNDNQDNGLIKNAYTKTVGGFDLETIGWDKYNIDFSYQTIDGLGYISLIFMDEAGNNKYALVLSESKNKILFVKFDNNKMMINKKDYELAAGRGYRVAVNAEKNRANVYINEQQIFSIKDVNLKNTKIGFETRNTYAYIRPLSVFKYNYNLKDPSTVKEYDIDENVLTSEHNKLVDMKIDYLKLKTFTDENSSLFVNNVHEWINLDNEKYSYNQSYKIKSYENKNEENVGWTKYTFGYDYETIQGDGELMALFEDLNGQFKYGFLVIEKTNETFFLRAMDEKLKFNKKTIPITAGKHNVRITVNKNNVETYFDNNLIFNLSDLTDYTNGKIGFELKNTNAVIEEVYAQNENINYSDPTVYVKYKKKYGIEKSKLAEADMKLIQEKDTVINPVNAKKMFTSPADAKETLIEELSSNPELIAKFIEKLNTTGSIQEDEVLSNTLKARENLIRELVSNPKLMSAIIEAAETSDFIQEDAFTNPEDVKKAIVKELITNPKLVKKIMESVKSADQEFKFKGIFTGVEMVEELFDVTVSENIDQSLNLNIPNISMVFDGYNARIYNWTGYIFTFGYTALDGKKQIINSFHDFTGKDKYSFLLSESTNDALFIDHVNENEIRNNISIREGWHTVNLEVNNNKAKYYLDGRLVFNLSNVDFTTGQFSLGTENTNAHFRGVMAINSDGQKKVYEIQDDPCELQKIGEAMLDKGNIIIEAGQKMTKGQTLNVNQPFDFGKVSVNVDDREIHFWVTNI